MRWMLVGGHVPHIEAVYAWTLSMHRIFSSGEGRGDLDQVGWPERALALRLRAWACATLERDLGRREEQGEHELGLTAVGARRRASLAGKSLFYLPELLGGFAFPPSALKPGI